MINCFLMYFFINGCIAARNDTKWEIWKSKYDREYASLVDATHAAECFQNNLLEIARLNEIDTAHYDVNQFSDLCPDEFKAKFARGRMSSPDTVVTNKRPDGKTTIAMDPLDYRTLGMVTPAKDQQVHVCGSCWAFSAVMTMEGAWAKAGHGLVSLSEQELVSCSTKDGCSGGIMSQAVDWTVKNGGIDSEADYPYEAKSSPCDVSKQAKKVATFNKTVILNKPNMWISPEDLYSGLKTYGPLSIGVFSYPLQHYSGGIMSICQTGNTDHGVGLAGYGIGPDKVGYWIVKNEWGKSWGEEGFMRVSLLYPNPCFINQSPVTAVIV